LSLLDERRRLLSFRDLLSDECFRFFDFFFLREETEEAKEFESDAEFESDSEPLDSEPDEDPDWESELLPDSEPLDSGASGHGFASPFRPFSKVFSSCNCI